MTIAYIYYSNSMGYMDYFVNKKLPELMAAYKKNCTEMSFFYINKCFYYSRKLYA